MLLGPGFLDDGSSPHWSEMTASCMLGLGLKDGEVVEAGSLQGGRPELSAACIHLGVRRARPDLKTVFHLHPPYSTALACTREPRVLQIHQNSTKFRDERVAVYSDYGFADAMKEGVSIGNSLEEGKDIMLMANHGILVTGATAAIAFDDAYYLERACMFQMIALAAMGGDESRLSVMDEETSVATAKLHADILPSYADKHFYSWWNKFRREQPDVFD